MQLLALMLLASQLHEVELDGEQVDGTLRADQSDHLADGGALENTHDYLGIVCNDREQDRSSVSRKVLVLILMVKYREFAESGYKNHYCRDIEDEHEEVLVLLLPDDELHDVV